MTQEVTLRFATINDLELLTHWDNQQHVIDCDPDGDWNWKEELQVNPPWREQYVAEHLGRPIGFLQIIDPYHETSHYWGSIDKNKRAIDIWIGEADDLNKGFGTLMMRQAIQKCFQNKEVTGILIDPLKTNTKAHRFYERLGFTFKEERRFDESLCFVYELQREHFTL